MVEENNNAGEPTQIFEYPLRRRLFGLVWLAMVNGSILIVLISTIMRFLLGTENRSATPGATPAFIIVGALLNFIGILVQLQNPAIRVNRDGFQISRLFYNSPWLNWREINSIKAHFMSSRFGRITVITVDRIAPIYSLVGTFQLFGLFGKRGFLVDDRIDNYEGLLQILRRNRPDLFD